MTTRQQAADGFYRHLREWFTAFLPRQRGAAPNTITSCRHTWNMLLGYAAGHHRVAVENVTFAMIDRATVTGFLDHMQAARSWTAPTRNQRLACIRSFFTYAAAAEPALAIYLAGLAAIPRLNGPAAAPVKYMTTEAVTALLAAPDPGTRLGLRDQFFMIVMYDLAARDAEMLALTLADIDARRLTADLLGKGSKPRRLPITSETARHFGRYAAVFHPSPEPGHRCSTPCGIIAGHGCPTTTSPGSSASTPLPPGPGAPTSRPGSTRTCCATHGPCTSTRPACPWPCSPNGSGTPTLKPRSSTPTPTLR